MNKHLNDWMDKAEGKEVGSSNKGIEKERVRQGYAKEKKEHLAKKIKHHGAYSSGLSDAAKKAMKASTLEVN